MTTAARPKAAVKKRAATAAPRPKKGPLTLPCGCDSTGHRCPSEERLGGELDNALAAFHASGTKPGDDGFPAVYRRLLKARQAYHAHFRLIYDPQNDALLQEHRCLQQSNCERNQP